MCIVRAGTHYNPDRYSTVHYVIVVKHFSCDQSVVGCAGVSYRPAQLRCPAPRQDVGVRRVAAEELSLLPRRLLHAAAPEDVFLAPVDNADVPETEGHNLAGEVRLGVEAQVDI